MNAFLKAYQLLSYQPHCSCELGERLHIWFAIQGLDELGYWIGESLCTLLWHNLRPQIQHAIVFYLRLFICLFPNATKVKLSGLITFFWCLPSQETFVNIGDSEKPLFIPVLEDSIEIVAYDFLRVLALALFTSFLIRIFFWIYFLFVSRPERLRHFYRQKKLKEAQETLQESEATSKQYKEALKLVVEQLQVLFLFVYFLKSQGSRNGNRTILFFQ